MLLLLLPQPGEGVDGRQLVEEALALLLLLLLVPAWSLDDDLAAGWLELGLAQAAVKSERDDGTVNAALFCCLTSAKQI